MECIQIPNELMVKKLKLKYQDGTPNGKQFRLKVKDMPFMRRGDFNDLYVQVKTECSCLLIKIKRIIRKAEK